MNAYCEKCGGRWLPRCPGESYGSCPWCEMRELRQQLAAANARAEMAGSYRDRAVAAEARAATLLEHNQDICRKLEAANAVCREKDEDLSAAEARAEIKWHQTIPGQIMGDGDEILVTGVNPGGKRWYEVVTIECDEDYFELRNFNRESCGIDWGDFDHWCYTKDIPGPDEAAIRASKENLPK